MKNHARFLRWNPIGVVVTEEFDYMEKPELMARFFWNFSHLTDEQRGHDLFRTPDGEGRGESQLRFGDRQAII
ncbi:hypothetical protein J3R82DRAFT_10007 [Butyriboletus roseoflavus]|nr:hypothetical protein J3R82DRAFT_10007 [Butyriboletus roseoflavus]